MEDMTEKERKDAKMAVIYELHLLIKASEKDQYTKDEMLNFLDAFATTKEAD